MTRKTKRLAVIGFALGILTLSVALVLIALRQEIVFFYSPSDLAASPPPQGERVRIGGLVEEGSVEHGTAGDVKFRVTDTNAVINVAYNGILPDLFREGQGVVLEGVPDGRGSLIADTVLAKHDETYMPPEVAAALKAQGVWQGDER